MQNEKAEFGSRSGLALSIVTYWELRNRMQESKARAGVTFISGYLIKPTAATDNGTSKESNKQSFSVEQADWSSIDKKGWMH